MGEKENASNLEKSLPVELWTEILDYFPAIGPYTTAYSGDQALPEFYLVRIDILRALSQVCIDYRRVLFPLLWNSLNICFTMRKGPGWSSDFYEHAGEALLRNCDGLLANPKLASYIGTIRVVLTRYQRNVTISKLALLSSLQNLHTLHIFWAPTHWQITTAIKRYLEDVAVFPRIHTLIIPGYCHGILKCCPQVTKVWCNDGDGNRIVSFIAKYCKEVQEMRGFLADERLTEKIIEAAPNLRVLEITVDDRSFKPMIDALPSFTNINTIIIKAPQSETVLDRCIEATKQRLKDLAPSKERRHIRIWYKDNHHGRITEINEFVRGYYSEVPI